MLLSTPGHRQVAVRASESCLTTMLQQRIPSHTVCHGIFSVNSELPGGRHLRILIASEQKSGLLKNKQENPTNSGLKLSGVC